MRLFTRLQRAHSLIEEEDEEAAALETVTPSPGDRSPLHKEIREMHAELKQAIDEEMLPSLDGNDDEDDEDGLIEDGDSSVMTGKGVEETRRRAASLNLPLDSRLSTRLGELPRIVVMADTPLLARV